MAQRAGWAVVVTTPYNAAAVEEVKRSIEVPEGWTPPTVLPPAWRMVQISDDGAKYINPRRELAAILSCCRELDGRFWLHVSVSHRRRLPTWLELVEVKELLLGAGEAYQVAPPRDRYVNIHPRALHLFGLLDGTAALPDFTHGTGSL